MIFVIDVPYALNVTYVRYIVFVTDVTYVKDIDDVIHVAYVINVTYVTREFSIFARIRKVPKAPKEVLPSQMIKTMYYSISKAANYYLFSIRSKSNLQSIGSQLNGLTFRTVLYAVPQFDGFVPTGRSQA